MPGCFPNPFLRTCKGLTEKYKKVSKKIKKVLAFLLDI
jgi:hypothetical protein